MGRPRGKAREKLLTAGFECLRDQGYAAASSRVISDRAGVNSSLLYYHFESVDGLLLESLARSNADRLERYRAAVEGTSGFADLVRELRELYRADLESGHVRVVSELVGAGISRPDLGQSVGALMEPWLELAESTIRRASAGSSLAELVDPEELALGVMTFYLGANLMTAVWPGRVDVEQLLGRAESLASLVDGLAAR